MKKITVLGSGGWGIALAMNAHKCGNSVSLWTPFTEEAEELSIKRLTKNNPTMQQKFEELNK